MKLKPIPNRLERLERMRWGEPAPPEIKVNLAT